MANDHSLHPIQSPAREVVTLVGNFTSGGTGVVSSLTGRGFTSATRVTTGVYLVTLSSIYPAVAYSDANVVSASTRPNVVLQCSPVVGKSMTVTSFAITSAGNAAIVDIPSGYLVHMRLDCFNSSVR